jgi:RNA polymerase sigma-70 factor, ECF subfamily
MTESKAIPAEEIELSTWIGLARTRWPQIALAEIEFQGHLASLGRLRPAFPSDTYLAAACALGDAAAIRALEDEFVSRVPDVIRRVDGSAAFAADVCQQLRIRLLVKGQDTVPRIARYTGEVPLSAWIRVIALRLAFNAKRGVRDLRAEDGRVEDVAMDDPEVEYLRSQYRETFVRSFKEALALLSKDDRTILRLHYVDGVNIDGIGRIFQVHRATVARWLVRIRKEVLGRAKSLLAEQVGAELDEAESVIGVLAGEVDFTISRVLGGVTVSRGPASG